MFNVWQCIFFYVPTYVEHNEFVERHIGSPTMMGGLMRMARRREKHFMKANEAIEITIGITIGQMKKIEFRAEINVIKLFLKKAD